MNIFLLYIYKSNNKRGDYIYMANLRFTPKYFKAKIDEYFLHCDEFKKPYTVSGLAFFLGTNRMTLLNYKKRGAAEDEDEELRELNFILEQAYSCIEAFAEEQLFNKGVPTAGVIFSLKNNYKWEDKTISVNTNTNINQLQELTDSELEEQLLKLKD